MPISLLLPLLGRTSLEPTTSESFSSQLIVAKTQSNTHFIRTHGIRLDGRTEAIQRITETASVPLIVSFSSSSHPSEESTH